MKPHAIKPEPKSPQRPSPPAAASKPPAVVSPSAVEEDGQVCFASDSEEDDELSNPVRNDVKEISSISPVVSRKPKVGAKTSPAEGTAAAPQAQEAKDTSKGLSGSPPQAARPAGTDGKVESKPQAAASSLQGGPLETDKPEAEEEDPVPTLGELLAV